MNTEMPKDIGEVLHVPEEQRLDEDDFVETEVNEDEFSTYEDVDTEGGEVVVLSTAHLDDEEVNL